MKFSKKDAIKEGKLSYTVQQKQTIVQSLQTTIKMLEDMIETNKARIQEVQNAPTREKLIGEEK